MAGTGVAMMIWGPFSAWLISIYTWRGSLTILACLQIQGVVTGALIKPIHGVPMKETRNIPSSDTIVQLNRSADIQESLEVECEKRTRSSCAKRTGLNYFARPVYCLFFTGLLLNLMGHITPMLFLVNRGVSVGKTEQEASLLGSVMGIYSLTIIFCFFYIYFILILHPACYLYCTIFIPVV